MKAERPKRHPTAPPNVVRAVTRQNVPYREIARQQGTTATAVRRAVRQALEANRGSQ